jgi:hypothetical protein
MPDLPAICGSISLPRDSDRAERRNDDYFQVRRLRVRQQAETPYTDDLVYNKAYFVFGKNSQN